MLEFKSCCREYVDTAMEMVRSFTLKEISIFKFAMIAFGMLVAIHSHKISKRLAPIIWLVFIGCYAYMIGNYIFYLKAKRDNL